MSDNFVRNNKYQRDNNKAGATRINEAIRAKEVRLIDENGEMLGVITFEEALAKAYDLGLDLVEINSDTVPSVCKILNYGKHKYQLQKKKQENKKKQKNTGLKELYIHLGIGEHDFQVKFRHLKAFLADGYKVKIGVKLRGREMAYAKKGIELLERFYKDIGEEAGAKLDIAPKLEGNNVIAIFAPAVSKVVE